MDHDQPSLESSEALLGLLDDPSPAVRKVLLAHFAAQGPAARNFLEALVKRGDRLLGVHARGYLEELKFTDPVAEFVGFIRSLNYELETGALLLSRTVFPNLDAGACCEQLDALAARCRELFAEPLSIREKCRILNRVLFHEHGFRGNIEHYTDPLNNFIDQTLARRKGTPLSLSIVYLLVAQRLGMDLEPVGLPGHFMVGCYLEDAPLFIDAFEQGAFRSPEEVFAFLKANKVSPKVSDLAPTPVREVLCRTCRNLAHHYSLAGDATHAKLFTGFVEEFEETHERHASP
ncbi:MAG TPA: transglutaminase-like domain-containing protein [Rariglobus sp.]|nr:transglutaminase-like domain-containing protein [Rariglobus sp.]